MSVTEATLRGALKVKLSSPGANGKVIGASLVDAIVTYLVDHVNVKVADELVMEDLSELASEAWQYAYEEALPATSLCCRGLVDGSRRGLLER